MASLVFVTGGVVSSLGKGLSAAALAATRPTAQNLFYAIAKVKQAIQGATCVAEARKSAVEAADAIGHA